MRMGFDAPACLPTAACLNGRGTEYLRCVASAADVPAQTASTPAVPGTGPGLPLR